MVGTVLLREGVDGTVSRVALFVTAAVAKGLLRLTDVDRSVKSYLAVAIGQTQMRALLDPAWVPTADEIAANARAAVAVLLALEAAGEGCTGAGTGT